MGRGSINQSTDSVWTSIDLASLDFSESLRPLAAWYPPNTHIYKIVAGATGPLELGGDPRDPNQKSESIGRNWVGRNQSIRAQQHGRHGNTSRHGSTAAEHSTTARQDNSTTDSRVAPSEASAARPSRPPGTRHNPRQRRANSTAARHQRDRRTNRARSTAARHQRDGQTDNNGFLRTPLWTLSKLEGIMVSPGRPYGPSASSRGYLVSFDPPPQQTKTGQPAARGGMGWHHADCLSDCPWSPFSFS
jgi:hypothetical protein